MYDGVSAVGSKTFGSLPKIEGSIPSNMYRAGSGTFTGAFQNSSISPLGLQGSSSSLQCGSGSVGFNAYYSNTAYSRNDHRVIPASINNFYCIKY